MSQLSFNLDAERTVLTVTELTAQVKKLLARQFDDVRVTGEISGVKTAASGHVYFTLKDAGAQVRCVLFRNAARFLRFKPQDGLAAVVRGSVDVWEARGEYQLLVQGLEPQGYGALQLAFEQLKKKLAEEGLFAAERKRPLPAFPRRIGIVTSPTGAVIRDMLNVLGRRFPGLHVRLYPTLVQGEGAVAGICAGLAHFSREGWAELVIVGRGGGSLEDLWAFNEEVVARAIAASAAPVISAVGHETDFTIADFVADLRAPTPSAAAELAVPDAAELRRRVETGAGRARRALRFALGEARRRWRERGVERASALLQRRLGRALQVVDDLDFRQKRRVAERLAALRRRWEALDRRLRVQDLRVRLGRSGQRLETVAQRLAVRMERKLAAARERFAPLAARLAALSPLQILERGYALVETGSGRLAKRPSDAPVASKVTIRLAEGRIRARVEESPAAD